MLTRFHHWLFEPRDNFSLVVFRALFGLLLFAEAFDAIFTGWVRKVFVNPQMTIPFLGFDWLATLLHGPIMYVWYSALALAGIGVMLGYRYKLSLSIYGIMWWAVYLIQKEHYNNHYYLMVILCGLMLLLPAHRSFSIDGRKRPKLRSDFCPNWCYFVLIGLFAIVYFFASINKIYPDWLEAAPIATWFRIKSKYWLIGPLLKQEWMPWLISYGGILFDGLIIWALLWKRTRWWAFGFNLFFHLFNSWVFRIGVFPYMMIAISVLFFPPNQVRVFVSRWFKGIRTELQDQPIFKPQTWISVLVITFLFLNIAFPLRHHFIEGDVFNTEEGHRMSWRMMLRSKSGTLRFKIKNNATGLYEFPEIDSMLSKGQKRTIATHPDAAYWFIQKLKVHYADKGWNDIAIYGISNVRVNKRERFSQYDEDRDLALVEWNHWKHNDWILGPEKDTTILQKSP